VECLWEGPQFLTIKVPLQSRYGEEPYLRTFFSVFLGIRDFTHEDILSELERRRDTNNGPPWSNSDAEVMYQFLDTSVQTDAEWRTIR
jgi:hypothetical protein